MSSSVPTVLPQFISIVTAALPAGFQVFEGNQMQPYVAPQTLMITGVRFTKDDPAEISPVYRHEEAYAIKCSLCSAAGDPNQAARMQETFSLYADVSIAIASNPTLNSTCRVAWTKQLGYKPTWDAKSFSVGQLDFECNVTVRVNSLS
jgi:hypothetical protein